MKLITCLLLLCTQLCFGQTLTFNQGGPDRKNYYEEIPYEEVMGKLYLTVEIAGKKHRFLFDTGAPVAISKEFATELGAKQLGKIKINDTFLRSDSTTVVELNAIKLGNLTFNGIPAINLFPDFYNCLKIDGVIGSNILRNSIVSINSQKKLLIITDQKRKLELRSKNSGHMITDLGLQSDPKISFYINDRVHAYIAFDTGDSQFIRLNKWLIDQIKPHGAVDSLATGYGSGGIGAFGTQENAHKTLYGLKPFTVGNAKFTNLKAAVAKEGIPAIGSKILDHGVITLDFINNKFYFDAYKTDNDLAQKRWTANYGFIDGKLAVAEIWDKESGIEQGSQVLAIDSLDVSKITLCEYITTKGLLEGKETAILTLKTKTGEVKKATINKQ
jgi:hypothetical protein